MSAPVPAIERVKELALALDASGLAQILRGLDDAEVKVIRAWVLGDKAFFASVDEREPPFISTTDLGWQRYLELHGSAGWMRTMCLVASCPPAEAAGAVRWDDLWEHMTPEAREQTARLVAEKPRVWAEAFLTRVAAVPLSRELGRRSGGSVAWLVSRGVADHDLPCPSGRTFLQHYLIDGWYDPLGAAQIRADRLTPEVIYLKVQVGVSATCKELHLAVPELLDDGTLERRRLIEACLESLTAQTSVGSQRVVAKMLAALDLKPGEVAGGLGFLIGVIATSDGSVGKVLLPLALRMVTDATELAELTRVIGGRKERRQKELLLSTLGEGEAVAKVGLDGVVEALGLLAAGQEDARLLRGIRATRLDLGVKDERRERRADPVGLWKLDVDPGPAPEPPWWTRPADRSVRRFLDRRFEPDDAAFESVLHQLLRFVSENKDGADLVSLCHRLRVDGSLGLARFNRLIEPVFLAGGLRILWPAALQVADDVASANRVLPGLPELLRLLTRYAHEVPDGWRLPTHLAQRAESPGETKTQLEARALGAALQRVEVQDFLVEPVTGLPRITRGLWDLRPRVPALGRILDPSFSHHPPIRTEHLHYSLDMGLGLTERNRSRLHEIDRHTLDQLARLVQGEGLGEVRARVAGTTRRPESEVGPAAEALGLWRSGALTPESYFDTVASYRWRPSLDRVVFAWTCEQLVLLPSHPGWLSHASWADGSVSVGTAVDQIRVLAGTSRVGPLDLLLTLTRLHVPDAEKSQALAGLDAVSGLELWTDPVVTHAAGDVGSFNVVPVMRSWVEAGGMTATNLPVDMSLFAGLTEADLRGSASHHEVRRRVFPRDPRLRPIDPPDLTYGNRTLMVLEDGHLPIYACKTMLTTALRGGTFNPDASRQHLTYLACYDGVLEAQVMVPAAIELMAEGNLPLTHFAECLGWTYERGALRELWPLGLAVAAHACTISPKPNGLAFLVGLLTSYAPEVPATRRLIPREIADLAASTGATKSHTAARELVAALDRAELAKT